jgi:prolyl-tRNA synthetase
VVIVDDALAEGGFVMGANVADHHVRHARVGRDYRATASGPIALAYDGAACERCGGALKLVRGVEVGNIFQLGTRYSEATGANYLDVEGRARPIVMGSYGIGLGRLLACVAEEYRDDRGLCLPVSVAPFHVSLLWLGRSDESRAIAEKLYADLEREGVEVLYDDRDAGAGVKFADADLRGMPLRLVVSDRSLKQGGVELTPRREKEGAIVPLEAVVKLVEDRLATLRSEMNARLAEVIAKLPPEYAAAEAAKLS